MSKSYPLYTSSGRWAGLLVDRYLYDTEGNWMGWVENDGAVYSVRGEYVGQLNRDMRVLRRRVVPDSQPRKSLPAPPLLRIETLTSAPLAPLLQELPPEIMDVLEEQPDRLHPVETAEDLRVHQPPPPPEEPPKRMSDESLEWQGLSAKFAALKKKKNDD